MSSIDKIIEKFPEELRLPMYEALTIAIEESRTYIVREEIVKVWEAIKELIEAQKKTEERLGILEIKMSELAEAQKRTEKRVEELAEAQKKTEKKVEELAEAQKRTEKKVEELAEAQKKTEKKVEELAEAQKKTENSLKSLIEEHSKTRQQLGGIQNTIGYTLENEAFKHLPVLLFKDKKIKIEGKLKRTYLKDKKGKMREVNIFGSGKMSGKRITLIGECKSQLSKNDVDKFLKILKDFEGIYEKILPVIVTHMITDYDVEEYSKSKGVIFYYSYDFE